MLFKAKLALGGGPKLGLTQSGPIWTELGGSGRGDLGRCPMGPKSDSGTSHKTYFLMQFKAKLPSEEGWTTNVFGPQMYVV